MSNWKFYIDNRAIQIYYYYYYNYYYYYYLYHCVVETIKAANEEELRLSCQSLPAAPCPHALHNRRTRTESRKGVARHQKKLSKYWPTFHSIFV